MSRFPPLPSPARSLPIESRRSAGVDASGGFPLGLAVGLILPFASMTRVGVGANAPRRAEEVDSPRSRKCPRRRGFERGTNNSSDKVHSIQK